MTMPPRVCVMTTGHLASCPRMLKAADTFVAAGYEVHVVMIRSGGWAAAADARLCATRGWRAHVVSYARADRPLRWLWSGVRQQAALAAVEALPIARARLASLTPALSRVAPEVVRIARALHCDFYYAGAAGAIGLAALAADGRVPWAVDFEDAHGLEPLEMGDDKQARRMRELESLVARGAAFVTAAGEGVASYYRARHGIEPLVIDNVFALGPRPRQRPTRKLALYWFSQTIGPRRGLELLIDSLGRAGVPVTLTLRGRSEEPFALSLRARATEVAPLVELHFAPPADPDEMIDMATRHDVGVSVEDASIPHRAICTPNKLFVYLAAGLAVAASPTPGQQPILASASRACVPLDPAATSDFEAAVRSWSAEPSLLHEARLAAWHAAHRRWQWDHPCEGPSLIRRVAEVLS